MPNILICDDERSICEMLDITLRREGYKVETVNSGEMAKRKLESALYDVVVTDSSGSATSASATLTVTSHTFTFGPAGTAVNIGGQQVPPDRCSGGTSSEIRSPPPDEFARRTWRGRGARASCPLARARHCPAAS